MTKRFSLQDLLSIYPFSTFELVSRGNLEEAFFLDIVEDIHQLKGGELLLLHLEGLREPVSEIIRKAAAEQASVIFIKGKSHVFNIPDITNGPPILFYQHDFSLQDIEKTLKLIDQLIKIDQFQVLLKMLPIILSMRSMKLGSRNISRV